MPDSDITDHPSAFIPGAFTEIIRNVAGEAEQMLRLHEDQLALIYQQKYFRMLVPREYDGSALSLPQVLRVEEGLSWADGSTGWVVALCSGAGWFAGFLQPGLAGEVFRNDKVCVAGSGAATGTANLVAGGYEVNGFWKYASGSLHATAFTANCVVQKNGQPRYNSDGTPMIRAFLFFAREVILHRHWSSMGMIATGSHSFEVKDLKVPANRCFRIDTDHAVLRDTIYRYPFLQLAETTLSVNLSGMGIRFLDLCEPIFSERMNRRKCPREGKASDLLQLFAAAKRELEKCRLAFYDAVERSWQFCDGNMELPQAVLADVSKASHTLARRSLGLIDELYPYCGLLAADTGQEINRVWRNIHTASQHALLTPSYSACDEPCRR